MNRRRFLIATAALAACARSTPNAPATEKRVRRVALTMDDPEVEERPRLSAVERDRAILRALADHGLHAALFVCAKRVDSPAGAALLDRWNDAGHSLCNHSRTHRSFASASMSMEDFVAEVEAGEAPIRDHARFVRRFRFPFLKEGDTAEKRDAGRAVLKERGYSNGHVTIDASDWAFDARLNHRLRREPNAELAPFRDAYLAHMLDRARYYDDLATALFDRPIAHTLLAHHSLLNALFLGDLIEAFREAGWSWIDAEEAYSDAAFRLAPSTLPGGESLIWSLAKADARFAATMRYPGEDDTYERATLDRVEPVDAP